MIPVLRWMFPAVSCLLLLFKGCRRYPFSIRRIARKFSIESRVVFIEEFLLRGGMPIWVAEGSLKFVLVTTLVADIDVFSTLMIWISSQCVGALVILEQLSW